MAHDVLGVLLVNFCERVGAAAHRAAEMRILPTRLLAEHGLAAYLCFDYC
jgi:hypothetical protein